MLWEVYWNLVNAKGFTANWLDAKQNKGNIIAMQLIIQGLKYQPCNPTLVSARDAILKADAAQYGGEHKCLIWNGFAKRGLGTTAKSYRDSFSVPAECLVGTTTVPATSVVVTSTSTVAPKTTATSVAVTTTVTKTSATPTPTSTSARITFPEYSSPTVTGRLVLNEKTTISYDLKRMSSICPILEFCWSTYWGDENCTSVNVGTSRIQVFDVVFSDYGTIYASFNTFSLDGSCSARDANGWSSGGYTFKVSMA
jgi:extracellular elastinolytic metalloproteinase